MLPLQHTTVLPKDHQVGGTSPSATTTDANYGSSYFPPSVIRGIEGYVVGKTKDNSWIYEHLVSPFCNQLIKQVPTWVAPNTLTMIGWVCNVIMYYWAMYGFGAAGPLMLTLEGDYDVSANLVLALLTLLYLIADACDGKQAFRTGSSSPFGELLDHGVDSSVMSFQSLAFVGCVGGGLKWALVLGLLLQVVFYCFHWRERFEETLTLGRFNGPTEALFFQISLHLFTGAVGPSFWLFPAFGSLTRGEVLLCLAFIGSAGTLVQNTYLGLQSGAAKGISTQSMLRPALPVIGLSLAAVVWLMVDWPWFTSCTLEVPPTSGSTMLEACAQRTHSWVLMINAYFSYLSVCCMIERMCNVSRPAVFYAMTLPVYVAAANSLLFGDSILARDTVNFLVCLIGWGMLFHFARDIAMSFCGYLGIKFWSIPYPNKATAGR